MAILKVAQIGNPSLRRCAAPVGEDDLADSGLRRLMDDLVDTMREYSGVGLAAPQVREGVRAFVMEVVPNERYPNRERFPLLVVLNPVVIPLGDDTVEDWEGCLSINGLRGRVPRHDRVRLRGLTPEGEELELELKGFPARVAQHETDHLDGVLYVDRMRDMKTLMAEEEFRRAEATDRGDLQPGGPNE